MYEAVASDDALSQGDIIDECPIFYFEALPSVNDVVSPSRARIVVLTQACDLAQPKTQRVLVALIKDAQELVSRGVLKANVIRDHVRRNQVYGWYFLPTASPPIDLGESIVDLHDLAHGITLRAGAPDRKRQTALPNFDSLPRASRAALRDHILTRRSARAV